jgi:two-component system, OmpR family, phosphate regulon sensor histidine kinase PhoR
MRWLKASFPSSSTAEYDPTQPQPHEALMDNNGILQLEAQLYQAPIAYILIQDSLYRVTWFNDMAKHLFGLQQEDIQRPLPHLIRTPLLSDFLSSTHAHTTIDYGKFRFGVNRIPFLGQQTLLQFIQEEDREMLMRIQSEFLGTVAHELNTPITIMNGFLELLEQPSDSTEATQHIIQRLKQQTIRLSGLASQLLQWVRTQHASTATHRHTTLDTLSFFDYLQSEIAATPVAQRILTWTIDSTVELYGDRFSLHSAFQNLIDNAIRYTSPEHGKIHMQWHQTPSGEKRFDVHDNGSGVHPDHLPRLGERFFRAGRTKESGTGLGLSIVKHVATQHRAELRIQSTLHQGSLFSFVFSR